MSANAKVTSREAQRLATRERVFSASVAEFKRTGVVDADVAAIVAEAGVAHGTFFFHFPTKEHVVAELGQREEVRMADELRGFLASPREVRDTLSEVIARALALERRIGTVLFREMLALYFSPSRPELLAWSDHPLITMIVGEFERAAVADEIAADVDPANSAVFFFLGLFALLVTHERGRDRALALEQYTDLLLRGMSV